MCGVHAMVVMPSDDAIRAIANDISRFFAPSSIPGSRWLCRSINFSLSVRPHHWRQDDHGHCQFLCRLELAIVRLEFEMVIAWIPDPMAFPYYSPSAEQFNWQIR